MEGCSAPRKAQSLCANHYWKWARYGDPLGGPGKGSQPKPLAPRFWARVNKTKGCWLWTGGTKNGYGRFWFKGQDELAHRFAYEYLVGPIPNGLTIDHVAALGCTSKLCVNPAHLEPVTHQINNLRADGVSGRNARKTHCKRGHPFEGPEADMHFVRGARSCRICERIRAREHYARQGD